MYRKSLIFLAAGMIALSSCGKKDNNKAAGESAAVVDSVEAQLVRTGLVEKRKIERKLQCTAVLDGWETVAVSPSVTGIIEKINKEIGDRVSTGEVVVRMDQTQLNQAKLAYDLSIVDSILKFSNLSFKNSLFVLCLIILSIFGKVSV